MSITELVSSLSANPYFGAGFGLFGVGLGAAVLRKAANISKLIFQRNFLQTLEVPCQDKSFDWVSQWITRNALRAQHLEVRTEFDQSVGGKIETKFDFIPSEGTHWIYYSSRLVKVERTRGQTADITNMGKPWETIRLTTWGWDRDSVFYPLLENAKNDALSNYEGKTVMYMPRGHEWIEFGRPRRKRRLSSVILEKDISERIFCDLSEFIDSSSWYQDRGIPYRRGYLLYGPPGCGKTSLITALAGELDYSICALNLSERGLTDDRLNHLINVVPSQSIVLLEDIDAAVKNRDDESDETKKVYEGLNPLTLSGVLNMLDGVTSSEARILFMTTNHVQRLDSALIRPGRVDFKEYIGHATDEQIERAFTKFYPESPLSMSTQFRVNIRKAINQPITVAILQGYFLFFKNNPQDALNNVDIIVERLRLVGKLKESNSHVKLAGDI